MAGNAQYNNKLDYIQRAFLKLYDITNHFGMSVFSSWSEIPGHTESYTYYTGVEAGNPSGNANIKTIAYLEGNITVITQTFTWDSSDKVLKITCT